MVNPNSEVSPASLSLQPSGRLILEHSLAPSVPEYFGIAEQLVRILEPMQRLEVSENISNLMAFVTGSIVGSTNFKDLDIHFVFSKGNNPRLMTTADKVDHKYITAIDQAFKAPKGGGIGMAIGLELDFKSQDRNKIKRHYPAYYDVGFTTLDNMMTNLQNHELVGSNLWVTKFGIVVSKEYDSQFDAWHQYDWGMADPDTFAIPELAPLSYLLADCIGAGCQRDLTERFSRLPSDNMHKIDIPDVNATQDSIQNYIVDWLNSKKADPDAREIMSILRMTQKPISPKDRLKLALFGKKVIEQVAQKRFHQGYRRALYPYLSALKGVSLWQAMRESGSTIQIYGIH